MGNDPLLGQNLDGRYEIIEPIGKGSMGIVYRARQLSVDRDVAVKVISPETIPATLSTGAFERFQNEAKTISRLRHPNTVKLYDFGKTGDGRLYLVMELLQGQPLDKLLEKGPLDEKRTLSILRQIADSLAEAHQNGIVHRDLKPANIFVDQVSGQEVVKVLDFGIAKVAASPLQTATGAVIGTPAYMSPEQAQGEPIDASTDVYCLGILAYHCLSGGLPFKSDTPVGILMKHVNEPPPPLTGIQISPGTERLIMRMLSKDPKQRPANAAEVQKALVDLDKHPISEAAARSMELPEGARPIQRSGYRRIVWWTVLVCLAGGLGLTIWLINAPKDRPKIDPSSVSLHQLTDSPAFERHATISPDGKYVAFVTNERGNADIYLRRVQGQRTINLTADSDQDDLFPAFSPDGTQIAFVSLRDGSPGLYLMGVTGESVRRIAAQAYNPAWTPDGRAIVFGTEAVEYAESREGLSELAILNLDTGERKTIFGGDAVQPSVSPTGKRIAYWSSEPGGNRYLWTIGIDGRNPKAVTDGQTLVDSPGWAPDGRSLYFLSNKSGIKNLWRVLIDEETGELTGPIEQVTAGSSTMRGLALSRNGNAVTSMVSVTTNFTRRTFDPTEGTLPGEPQIVATTSRYFDFLDLSPDGKQLVYTAVPREHIVIMSADGRERRDLTDDTSRDRRPRFSPDGSQIAFYSMRSGSYEAWVIKPDGTGLRQVTEEDGSVCYPTWTTDGQGLWHWEEGLQRFDLTGNFPAKSDKKLTFPIRAISAIFVEEVSPDGSLLSAKLYPSTTAGVDSRLVVFDLLRGESKIIDSRVSRPRWLASGKELVAIEGKSGKQLVLVDVTNGSIKIIPGSTTNGTYQALALTKDSRTLYATESIESSDLWLLKLPER